MKMIRFQMILTIRGHLRGHLFKCLRGLWVFGKHAALDTVLEAKQF